MFKVDIEISKERIQYVNKYTIGGESARKHATCTQLNVTGKYIK